MTVFFDHQAFCIQEYGGLSRYYTELIAGLQQSGSVTPLLPLRYANNRHLQDAGLHNRPFFANQTFRGKQKLLYAINRWNDIRAIKTQPFDIFHATYYDPYFLPYLNARKTKTPLVVTFLDMIHEKLGHQFPELAQDKAILQHKRVLAKRADRLIAVSESTKRDVVEILNVDPDRIDVIYHGSSIVSMCSPMQKNGEYATEAPYLLFVGVRKGYKNFEGMLRAICPLLRRENIRVVCAGGGSFTANERQLIHSLGVTKLVSQQAVTDDQLRLLYQNAVAFVFPSLYEGFGIPVLEAMACGCPCILSNRNSLLEIGGNSALYFDPESNESMLHTVTNACNDETTMNHLRSIGKDHIKKFKWQDAVNQTVIMYGLLSQ